MSDPLLECRGLGKGFAGVRVLAGVDLSLPAGGSIGLVGENGAGKSTLMNILGGVLTPDEGTITLGGEPYRPASPADASRRGVGVVHQELNLFPNLSIAENLLLDDLPTGPLGLDRAAMDRRARDLLAMVRLDRDPRTPVERLPPGERQLVEIARALRGGARLILFDEPTTSLTAPEADRLFAILADLRARGIAVIYISHDLGHVLRVAEEVVVLRDGAVVARGAAGSFTEADLVRAMVGRSIDRLFPTRPAEASGAVALEAVDLTRAGAVEGASLRVRRGEILGVAGLMGSGRTELVRLLFGLDPADSGEVRLHGARFDRRSPSRSLARGMAFLTEDRRGEGLLMDAPIDDNLALATLPRFSRLGWMRRTAMRSASAAIAERLAIGGDRSRPARALSGGNQQKVVLAKSLLAEPDVFLLDEPTRGVDVGAKAEIYRAVADLAGRGAAVVLVSSELEELIGLADRILVLRGGKVRGEFARAEFDREAILRVALGGER